MRIAFGFCAGLLWGVVLTVMVVAHVPGVVPDRATAPAAPPLPRLPGPASPVTGAAAAASPGIVAVAAAPPATSVAAQPAVSASLLIPVMGVQPAQLVDTFEDARGHGRVHDAIDIVAPRGTPVLAARDGTVAKLFRSRPGGITVYEFDPARRYAYYYAHLERYAPGLAEGQVLSRGQVIGFVGSSGDASAVAPHLHFAIFLLGPDKRWWTGTAVDPYPVLRSP